MTMKLLSFLLLAGTCNAFLVTAPLRSSAKRVAFSPVMGIEETAAGCLEDGCSLQTVDELLAELKAENAALTKRQQSVLLLIGKLQALSSSPEAATANKSEIEALVAAAARSFSPQDETYDFPGDALGYTMKPTGGTVAGKVW